MTDFGALSYALLAGLYLFLTIMLLISWRGSRVGGLFIVASLVSLIWAVLLTLPAAGFDVNPLTMLIGEVMRYAAWTVFLAALIASLGFSRSVPWLAQCVWFAVLAAALAAHTGLVLDGSPGVLGSVFIPGGLAMSLAGLVLIEQLYRNANMESRRRIRHLVVGLGAMFAFDLYLFSQGVLFGAIDDSTLTARGMVNLLFVPLLAVAARRNPDWELRIFVSRQVVFYSTTLVAVGTYLLLMSAGGYLLLEYGGSWGGPARIVFIVGAVIVLVALLFSGALRSRLKVFLSKHFFQNKYDYREEWLGLVSSLSQFEDRSTPEVVISAAAKIVDSPAGVLWVLDETETHFEVAASVNVAEVPPQVDLSDSIAEFMRQKSWIVDLGEHRHEPELYGNLEIPSWLAEFDDAWLVLPLFSSETLLGFIALTAPAVKRELNYEDRDLLKLAGRHIAVHIAQQRSERLLAESSQFEAYNRLTAFLMHDLNNLIAQQSLIVANAEKHKRNPEFVDDAIATISNSVEKMKGVMAQLKRGAVDEVSKSTPLKFVLSTAVDRCSSREPVPQLDLQSDAQLILNSEEFIMVLSHLIRNAQEATPRSGEVVVRLTQAPGEVIVSVCDTGSGMSAEFVRQRLFRPFDSTKGVHGMGIGAYQARQFVRKLGGDLSVTSSPGAGSTMVMTFPLDKDDPMRR